MKKNVLIFGGGGYNALQIYAALKDCMRFYPVLASSNDNHSVFVCSDAITDLPYDNAPDFVEKLNEYIKSRKIEYIIPTHDTAALRMMERQDEINAVIVCSPLETSRICRYKSLTYQSLKGLDFVPEYYEGKDSRIQFPVFAKEDTGQGGRNASVIRSQKELDMLDRAVDYVLCEYLPGNEITIDCFTDRNGNLRFIQPRSRERLLNGISARSRNLELTEEIENIVRGISGRIKFHGYWFVQCKQDKHGKYKLMEVSTRFAGTYALSKNLDVNLPLLALCDFAGMDIEIAPNQYHILSDKTYIDRYRIDYHYERVYIDFDDTLVFDRKTYNTEAMKFLYQCLNKGKRIVLITKHESNIRETMQQIRLNGNLFDEIIEVPGNEPKSSYVDNEIPSVFIDNAYAERREVKKRWGMPTFDVSNIEALIDWR